MVYALIAFAAASLGFAFAKRHLRWNLPLAITRALVDAACPAILIYLALTDRVLNPAFVSAADWPAQATRWTNVAIAVIAAGSLVHTTVELAAGIRRRTWVTPNWKALIHTAADGMTHLPRRRSARI